MIRMIFGFEVEAVVAPTPGVREARTTARRMNERRRSMRRMRTAETIFRLVSTVDMNHVKTSEVSPAHQLPGSSESPVPCSHRKKLYSRSRFRRADWAVSSLEL